MRIEARAVRPYVQNADGRKRVNVLYAARQIAFAGNRHDRLRANLLDRLARERAARHDEEMEAHLIGKIHESADVAAAAALAVVRVARNLVRARRKLQAMRRDNEKLVRMHLDAAMVDDLVADLDEGAFDASPVEAEHLADHDGYGKEQIDQRVRLLLKNMQERQAENRPDHAQDAETREKYDAREEDAEHERQIGIDFEQTEVAHAPDGIGEERHAEEAQ